MRNGIEGAFEPIHRIRSGHRILPLSVAARWEEESERRLRDAAKSLHGALRQRLAPLFRVTLLGRPGGNRTDPCLAGLVHVASEWMTAGKFFAARSLPIASGHSLLVHSPLLSTWRR